jgi:hypothetical protein
MKTLSILIICSFLAGCVSTTSMTKSENPTMSNSAFVGWSPSAQDKDKDLLVYEVDGKNVEDVLLGVHLDAGKHSVKYECRTGSNNKTLTYKDSSKRTDDFEVENGNMYFLRAALANVSYTTERRPSSAVQTYTRDAEGRIVRNMEYIYDDVEMMHHDGCGIMLSTCEGGYIYQDKKTKKIVCSKRNLNMLQQMKEMKTPLFK